MCRNNKQDQTKNLILFRNLEKKISGINPVKNGRKRINYKEKTKRKFHAKFEGKHDTCPGTHRHTHRAETSRDK